MKESCPSIEDSSGPLDPEDTWWKIIISLTAKSKERIAHFIGEWSYLVVTLSRAREAKPYFGVCDMESWEESSQHTRDAKVWNVFFNKAMVTASGYICWIWRKELAVLSSISKSQRSQLGASRPFITGITICDITMRSGLSDHWRSRLLIRLDKVHKFTQYEAPFVTACGHHQWSHEGKKLEVLSSI